MKILKLRINNFDLCHDGVTIDFLPVAKKTLEDKEYELIKVADELYVYNTLALIGKNASGKTTLLRLLYIAYEILSYFRVEKFKSLIKSKASLELTFIYEGNLYYYKTDLINEDNIVKFNWNNSNTNVLQVMCL